MTDGNGECVGRIMRCRRFREPEQQLDHLLHLVFLGPAIADDGALDLGGGVLDDLAPGLDGGKDRHPPCVAQLERAARVHRVKQTFDGNAVGAVCGEQRRQLAVNAGEPLRKRVACGGADRAACNQVVAPPVGLDATVAGALGTWVDAKNSHASEASISFSSMSKFVQTCWTLS